MWGCKPAGGGIDPIGTSSRSLAIGGVLRSIGRPVARVIRPGWMLAIDAASIDGVATGAGSVTPRGTGNAAGLPQATDLVLTRPWAARILLLSVSAIKTLPTPSTATP